MKPSSQKRSCAIEVCAILIWLAEPVIASNDPNEMLARRLIEIRADGRTATEDPCALEARCLQLLADHNAPSQRGMIYATIASVYSERGYPSSLGQKKQQQRLAKTAEYARKALEYPLDVLRACKMYGALTDAIIIGGRRGPKDKWLDVRREAIVPCLMGLKLALDNKAPKDRPSPPLATIRHVLSGSRTFVPQDANEVARREQQSAARKQYERLRELYMQRRALTERSVALYAEEPYDTEELRALVRKMLPAHDEAVNELVQLVEGRIAARK
jgi:hypothetical protein